MTITVIAFLGLILIGTPIVFALGVSATLTLYATGVPMSIVAQRIFAGLDSFTIMAIPFFVFAGIIMERGGIAQRIIEFLSQIEEFQKLLWEKKKFVLKTDYVITCG